MADDKPCISDLYESGGLDMDLVSKIAHNELDKRKGSLFNSEHALASEYIDAYIDDHPEVIENYADELDSKLSVEDYRNGQISPEFVLGGSFPAVQHRTHVAISSTSTMNSRREPLTKYMRFSPFMAESSLLAETPMISRSQSQSR